MDARPARHLRSLAGVALPLVLAGCSMLEFLSPDPATESQRRLAAAAELWERAGIDDYRFTIVRGCFCPADGPSDVTVRDGVVTEVRRGGVPIDPAELPGVPLTIPAVFDLLRGLRPEAEFVATYDPETGVPTDVSVDPIPNAIDDEFGLTITNVVPLP